MDGFDKRRKLPSPSWWAISRLASMRETCRTIFTNAGSLGVIILASTISDIRGASQVVAWGLNTVGQTNVPPGLTNVTMIACGIFHNLALKSDGKVVGWGQNTSGETNVPGWLTNATAVAAGWSFSLALRADGTVAGWGQNNFRQTNAPIDLTNAVAVAAGGGHCVALRANGTVSAWGLNSYGQTNVPPGLSNIVAIAAAFDSSLALTPTAGLLHGESLIRRMFLSRSPMWLPSLAA